MNWKVVEAVDCWHPDEYVGFRGDVAALLTGLSRFDSPEWAYYRRAIPIRKESRDEKRSSRQGQTQDRL